MWEELPDGARLDGEDMRRDSKVRIALGVFVIVSVVVCVSPGDLEFARAGESSQALPRHSVRCTATAKVVCGDGQCNPVPPTVFFLLEMDADSGAYSRCDQQGCDTYEMAVKQAGIYENWQPLEPRGVIFKRSTLESDALEVKQEFVEVATLGLEVYLSFGMCENSKNGPRPAHPREAWPREPPK